MMGVRCTPRRLSLHLTLIITTTPGLIHVTVRGMPTEICGVGQNEAHAIGDLISKHGPKLGINIVRHD